VRDIRIIAKPTTFTVITGMRYPTVISSEVIYIEETLIGTINNININFTTSQNYLPNSTELFVNGLKQRRGTDYFENQNKQIQLSEAPQNVGFTDQITIKYIGV
jgi:hypothetical protein